jgi:hypothetical protein
VASFQQSERKWGGKNCSEAGCGFTRMLSCKQFGVIPLQRDSMFICLTVYSSWIPREVEPRRVAPI